MMAALSVRLFRGLPLRFKDSKGKSVIHQLNDKGFEDITFDGQYPVALIDYKDEKLPVSIQMEAFSPFIPLNAKQSGFPATIFNITIENTSTTAIEASAQGFLENPVAFINGMHFTGERHTDFTQEGSSLMLTHSATQDASAKDAEKKIPPQIFELFHGEDWGEWTVVGDAFGPGPVAGTLPKQAPVALAKAEHRF